MAATSRIAELASTIQVESANIEEHLLSQGLKAPSWDLDTPPQIPLLTYAAQASQNAILEAMDELKALILGPIPSLINKATDAVWRFKAYMVGEFTNSTIAQWFARHPSYISV